MREIRMLQLVLSKIVVDGGPLFFPIFLRCSLKEISARSLEKTERLMIKSAQEEV